MVANQKELYSLIDQIFKSYNFIKKGGNWYYTTNECIVIFGIEKSQWSGKYGTVLTVLIRELEDCAFPKPHQSHMHGIGLQSLVNNREKLQDSLNLDSVFKNEEREEIIKSALIDTAIPFLLKISTIIGLKTTIEEQVGLKRHLTLSSKKFLKLNE